MGMQQQQPPPGGGPNGPNSVSNTSGAAGTGGQYYGAPSTGAQMQNVGNDVGKFSNSASSGTGPTNVHSQQQNGYVSQPVGQNAGAGNYGSTQPPSSQQQSTTANQTNSGGSGGGGVTQSSGGGGSAGTWTGPNTLTYTQSMQPPDPRSLPTAYCKS